MIEADEEDEDEDVISKQRGIKTQRTQTFVTVLDDSKSNF